MKKIFFILTTLITIFGTTNVFALDLQRGAFNITTNSEVEYTSGNESYWTTKNFIGFSNTGFAFNNAINFNTDYVSGQIFAYNFNASENINVSWSNVDYTATCNRTLNAYETDHYAIIYYQDGSQATINYNLWQQYCNGFNITSSGISTATGTKSVIDTDLSIQMQIYASGGVRIPCDVSSNGFFTCKLENNATYNGFTISVLNSGSTNNIRYGLKQWYIKYNDSTSAIINNQNQNTQTITNTLIDDTISNGVITDTNNIGNSVNTDSKNVVLNFLMIPFTFMTNVVNSFDNQCQTICLGNCPSGGGGHDDAFYFVLPCINLQQILGNTIYGIIDALMCVTMIFAFIRSVIKFIQKCLLLEVDVSSEVRMFS